jgi:hypothetical protein
MPTGYREPQDMNDWMREIEKRLGRQERRQGSVNATVTGGGDGEYIPSPVRPPPPTEPPASAPTIKVSGTKVSMVVVAQGEVAPTTVLDYYLDSRIVVEGSRSTVISQTVDADGNPLKLETDYAWTVAARNDMGAVLSETVIGRLDPNVEQQTVLDWVSAGFLLAGTIQVGTNITINPASGITIKQANGLATKLTADGTGDTFVGEGTFESATFKDKVTIRGPKNFLNGTMTASSGVTDPTSKPTVSISYPMVDLGGAGYNRRGLCENPAATLWVTTDTVSGGSTIQGWEKDGTAGYPLCSVLAGYQSLGGITRIGNIYYVLVKSNSSGNWFVQRYDATTNTYIGNSIALTNFLPTAYPVIGTDGTDLLIGWPQSNIIYVRRYNTATVQIGNSLAGPSWGSTTNVSSVQIVGSYCYVGWFNALWAYTMGSTTLTAAATEHVPLVGTNMGAAFHNGTVWNTFHSGRFFYRYSSNRGTWSFGYTWYDNDTTGGSTTAETRVSSLLDVTPTRFAHWTLTLPSNPPDDGTLDGANAAIFYARQGAAPLYRIATLAEGSLSATFDPVPTSGTAYSDSSGFESRLSTAFGNVQSTKQEPAGSLYPGPLWKFTGNGSGRAGAMRWDENGFDVSGGGRLLGTSVHTSVAATASEFNAGTVECTLRNGRRYRARWTGPLTPGTTGQYTVAALKYAAGAVVGGTVFATSYTDHRLTGRTVSGFVEGDFIYNGADLLVNIVVTILGVGGTTALSVGVIASKLYVEEYDV